MWFRNDFAFSSARYASIAIVFLLVHASPTLSQVAGFDVFTAPPDPEVDSIAAGSVYTIKWIPSPPAGKISIILLEGTSDVSFHDGPIIANSIDSDQGSYAWQVPLDLPGLPIFALKLFLVSDITVFQYSTTFAITGLSATESSGSQTSTSTATIISPPSTLAVPSSASSSSTSPSAIPPSASTSPSPSPTASASNDTLTTGAKAGIGIGASLGGILLFALIAFTFFRYGKRSAMKADAGAGTWEKAELGTGRPPETLSFPRGLEE